MVPRPRGGARICRFLGTQNGEGEQDRTMKIKVDSEKIVKAVRKLYGIEMVLQNAEDAKEALNLILKKKEIFREDPLTHLKDVSVSSFQEYKTSAVDYRLIFLLEFFFKENVSEEFRVTVIKELQDFFNKV